MLIIPVEQKPDWRHPPVITVLLILANCLIFLLYQIQDDDRIDAALQAYQDGGLYQQEADLYIRHVRFDPWMRKHLMDLQAEDEHETVMVHLIHDLSFDQFLREQTGFSGTPWEQKRLKTEQLRNQISYVRFGYKPGDPSLTDAFLSMFLHGGFGHLLGNMIFLFIFGFGLEASLGRTAYLSIYLLTGFAATGLYQLMEWNSLVYGVGASGAISGLMGCYLAVYGLRKIKFFYTLGFYFNTILAPAIIVLPFWLGKELLGALFNVDNINYWAHLGGLVGGFLITYGLIQKGLKVEHRALTEEAVEKQEDPFTKDRRKLENLVMDMQLFKAIELCPALLKKYPREPYILQTTWNLLANHPAHPLYKPVAETILGAGSEGNQEIVERVYRSYCREAGHLPDNEQTCLNLLERFLKTSWQKDGVQMAEHLMTAGCQHPRLKPMLVALARKLRNVSARKSRAMRDYVTDKYPQADPA